MHHSVLLQEVIDTLDIKPTDVVFDGTFGGGGHSKAILAKLGKGGVLVSTDTDASALRDQEEILNSSTNATVHLVHANFRNLDDVLGELGITSVDKFLFDLGYSSIQLEEGGRGLSFKKDEPLLMTLADTVGKETLTAERIVNEWTEGQIETVLRGYGEESFSKRIAKAIVAAREIEPIKTTSALAEIVANATPAWYRHKRIHPATKTFQALRIAVNDELDAIREALERAAATLSPDGRIAVITFHSLEDRVVKRIFKAWKKEELGEMIPKKPIVASKEETKENPRARSAKLRIFIKNS